MLLHPIEINETASSGTWAINSTRISGGQLAQIYIKSATPTTTFDFKIIDSKDNIVYDTEEMEKTATGILNDTEVAVPLLGIYTFQVYNSSADEAFTGRIMVFT